MRLKTVLLFVFVLTAAAFAAELEITKVEVVRGELAKIDVENAPYGGVHGSVKLRLGFAEWHPSAVWLLPSGEAEYFSYTGSSYTVPSSLNLTNNCRSSIYFNATLGYAFKSSVKENGTFCILADPGSYKFVAEY